jgi:hypothetical protein
MMLAYDNGAKYIVVFDSNYNHTAGSLNPEHFQAMQQFWQYIQHNPRKSIPADQRVAYVLPKDYGVGLRWRDEKIWGLFDADNVSTRLYDDAHSLLKRYGANLDIIYDDDISFHDLEYGEVIFWDSYDPASPTPSPSQPVTPDQQFLPQPVWYAVAIIIGIAIIIVSASFFIKRSNNKLSKLTHHRLTQAIL